MKFIINKILRIRCAAIFIILFVFSVNSYAQHEWVPDYYFGGVANVIRDSSKNTVIELGVYNYTADRNFGEKGATFHFGAPYIATQNINGYIGIDLGNGFYALYGYRDASGIHLVQKGDKKMTIPSNAQFIMTIVTTNNGSNYTGTFSYSGGIVGIYQDGNSAPYTSLNISNMTITVSNSSCDISTSHNMAFYWGAITPGEIKDGSSQVKNAPITMECGGATGSVPVAVTLTSSNGNYDAENGIVKTDKENLGLKLTWANSGAPIPMDREIDFPSNAESTENFSINAKPVPLGDGQISGGDFYTKVTMSLEYR